MFRIDRFQKEIFCLFSISSIIYFGTTDVKDKWTISGKVNILKTIILRPRVKFLMRHILRTLWMFDIAVKNFVSMLSLFIVWKINFENLDGIYVLVNTFYTTDCHFHSFQGSNNFTLRKVRLKTKIFRIIRKHIK